MSNTTTSQYMSLPVPIPTQDPGPQYAIDLNSCLTLVDQHTHTTGSGQQIVSAAISINADLPFNGYNATTFRSARFSVQNTPLSGGQDLGCVYVSGVDLYYNDSNGNQVRLTQSGAVAGTPGSITNLLSPASVTYVSGTQTYVFQSSTATPGNIDCGAITLRQVVANSNGVTISPPAGLPSSYSLTLFQTLPSTANLFVQSDTAGNLRFAQGADNSSLEFTTGFLQIKNNGVTQGKLQLRTLVSSSASSIPIGGIGISGSCGTVSVNGSNIRTALTNCSLSIITAGRPIYVGLINSSSGLSDCTISNAAGTNWIQLFRDTTAIATFRTGTSNVLHTFDPIAAGTYSYRAELFTGSGGNVTVVGYNLCLYEI